MKIPFFLSIIVSVLLFSNLLLAQQGLLPPQAIPEKITLDIIQPHEFKKPSAETLIARAIELKLYEEKQWIDLLHIRPNALGLKRSQVTGKDFFIAVDGFKNPKSELEATIRALLTESKEESEKPLQNLQYKKEVALRDANTNTNTNVNRPTVNKHPICFFPARKRWLQQKLQISDDRFAKPNCALYDYFITHLNADSVSIVFSSYYPNNPGSVFGHTLFRINKKLGPNERRNELLDHGIGYAANANIDNPVLYAAYGLFGGFKGVFSNVPYYYKVREYNDFESRSLWSYDLNLTPDELSLLVDHLWEVGSSSFDYYFFTQNCGFHMLTVLEAAVPRLRVVENIPFWVIPSDTVKVINKEPDLVKNVSYRASVEEKFYQRWNLLSETEKKYLLHWKQSKSLEGLESLSLDEQIHILDAVIDLFDYKNPNVQNDGFEELQKERNQLLLRRAKLQKVTPELEIAAPVNNRPDFAHGSGRFGFKVGSSEFTNWDKNRHYEELQVRFALHDLLDSPFGYPPGANIEFMNFRFRHWQKSAVTALNASGAANGSSELAAQSIAFAKDRNQLEEFTLFRLVSLFPIDEFHKSPSWNFSVTSKRIYDQNCMGCYAGGIEGGVGGTLRSSFYNFDTFAFLNSSLLYSGGFIDSNWALNLSPQVGMLYRIDKFYFKLLADSKWYLANAKTDQSANKAVGSQELEFRHNLSDAWSWGAIAKRLEQNAAFEFSLYRFF
jgi:hypothetical protein